MRMKAAILFEQGLPRPYAKTRPLVVEEVELDPPGSGEILIEIAAAGLCHSDLSTIENQRPRPLPIVIGHEGAGIVRECGAGVTDLKPGDHVITVFASSCGTCRYCARGRPNICPSGNAA
ncbi:MAG: alcohol dehydrogenase catalytic domain-containing protein, partial [Alphaproteobacteria bacterium]